MRSSTRFSTRDLTLIALFAVLAIIGGKIVLPVLMIPFTLQTAVCLLTGLLLGGKRAMLAQGLYIFMGLAGLPVFAAGGGPAYVLQPSFGYLPGMLLGAGLIGILTDRVDPRREQIRFRHLLPINLAGLLVIYLCGVGYLYIIKNIYTPGSFSFIRALQVGFLPYLITDGSYMVAVAAIGPAIRRATRAYLLPRPKIPQST
ncbi:MAG: biotin transporter BioY [Clostridiaceae bacterium]|nr:biotin transporter BioY [Clostridiaceae bacterium]